MFQLIQQTYLFALPSVDGHGTTLHKLAKRMAAAGVFSLDFITDDDRLERYAAMIERVQPHGDVLLFGYGAGGNLAFEVARQLEKNARRVRSLILFDSVPMGAAAGIQLASASDVGASSAIGSFMTQAHLSVRTATYQAYARNLRHTGRINAPIHAIASEEMLQSPIAQEHLQQWQHHTSHVLFHHRASGEHSTALIGPQGEANARLICQIVEPYLEKAPQRRESIRLNTSYQAAFA